MNNENENLNELLSGFYDEQEINEFKNNLKSFDEMLNSNPAPSEQTIDGIKSAVAEKLSSHKHKRFAVLQRIAVAAMVLLIAFAGLKTTNRQDEMAKVTEIVATTNLFDEGETSQITAITEQIEQIEDALLSVRLDEYDTYIGDSYTDLETELSEINGDFWKG